MAVSVTEADIIRVSDFTSIPFQIFTNVGVRLFVWDENDRITISQKLFCAFIMVNLAICYIAKMAYLIVIGLKSSQQMTEWLVYFCHGSSSVFKFACVCFARKKVESILREMDFYFPATKKEQSAYRVKQYYLKIKRYGSALHYIQGFATALFFIMPITTSSVNYWKGEKFVYNTPFIMLYPFDYDTPVLYFPVVFSQFMGGMTNSWFYIGSDLLMATMVHILNMNFEYLSYRLSNFKASEDRYKNMQELRNVSIHHRRILDQANRINFIYRIPILMSYFLSIFLICFIGFQVMLLKSVQDLIKFGCLLLASLMCVFYQCHFGSSLVISSENFVQSLSTQEWYMADVRYQRMLLLIMARAQRPARLMAFKFFAISMESFATLMTSSYQFFTLIKTQYDKRMAEDTID